MFSKKNRVNKALFSLIMKNGKVINGSFFVFKFIKGENYYNYAFVVSKKVAKTAVLRNKMKRRGYFALKSIDEPGICGVFMYKNQGKDAKIGEIRADLEKILKKVNG